MNIAIRRAKAEDCAAIAQINRSSMGYECTDEQVKNRLSRINEESEAVFAAVCGTEVVGYIHVQLYELLYSERLVNVLGLAVDKAFRRQGIAKRLIAEAETWAKEHGAVGVRLNSGAERTGAHEFYRAAGYGSEKQQIRFQKLF